MNLRILKKLSKRAAPMLMAMGSHANRTHYVSEAGDGDCDVVITDRKHMDRRPSSRNEVCNWGNGHERGVVTRPACRRGSERPYLHLVQPLNPWQGTPLVGWMSGYYEPEWEERTAWGDLSGLVIDSCMDFAPDGTVCEIFGQPNMEPVWRNLPKNPADVFRQAMALIESNDARTAKEVGNG